MMLKKMMALILAFTLFCPPLAVYSAMLPTASAEMEIPDELSSLYAQSAILMDADSGRILFEKKGHQIMPMASTTKIMTCIIALEHGNPEDTVIISANAAKQPKVHLGMRSGQEFKLGDLLYSLMLESHNDTAVAIAEHIGGSVEGFARLMNQKAKELGALHTNFVTPNGLDAPGHQTTAAELGLIARYALQNERFVEITNTASHSFSDLSGQSSYSVQNLNSFLHQMDGAIGMKTGFTGKAGYCFVGAVKQGDRTFISVVLAAGWPPNKNYKWHDTRSLMEYGTANYHYQEILVPNPSYQVLPVEDGQIAEIDTEAMGGLTLLVSEADHIEIKYDCPKQLQAPIKKGQEIGKISVLINGTLYCEFSINAKQGSPKINYEYCLKKIFDCFAP